MAGIVTPWASAKSGWDFAAITACGQIHCFSLLRFRSANLTVKRTVKFFSEAQTLMDTGENKWDQGNNSEVTVNFVRRKLPNLLVLHMRAIDHRINMSQCLSQSPNNLSKKPFST
jgi:hypothetical protein